MTTFKDKTLVTGIAGLIGSHMAEYLLGKGHEVYGIDNLSGGYIENVPKNAKFFQGDLGNKKWMAETFATIKPDYVYHFAAYAAEGLSPFIRNFNYSNNLLCSINVINECIKNDVKKIIFTSSMAVYGEGTPPFKETDQPQPIDPYGISKYTVEMDLACAKSQFGLNYSIIRPHNVVGIRQNIWDKYRNVIGIWIRRILRNESVCIFGDGLQERALSDIKFCLEPMYKLLTDYDGEIFNLGAPKQYALNEVANVLVKIAKEFNFDATIEHLEPRIGEAKYAYCNHDKAEKLLGFKDATNLEETIREMFVWAMKQEDREVKQMNYEISKNMYNYWK